jgi:PAS domain S-box-containing protein
MPAKPARPRRSILDKEMARLEGHQPASAAALSRYVRDLRVAAMVTNEVGTYVMTNAAASRLTGYSADELCKMSVWDLTLPTNDRETDVLWRNFVHVGAQRGVAQIKTKKGSVVSARYVAKSHLLKGLHISLLQRVKSAR